MQVFSAVFEGCYGEESLRGQERMFLKALLGLVLLAFLGLPATSFVFPLRNGRPCAVPASTFTAGPWVRGGGAAPLMAGMGKARRSLIHSLASSDRAEEDERLSEAEGQATTIIHAVETLIGLPVDQVGITERGRRVGRYCIR